MKSIFESGALRHAPCAMRSALRARRIGSIWAVEHYDLFGRLKSLETGIRNIVPDEGLDAYQDIMGNAATQITTWYVVLFESNTTPAAGHTYAVPVYTEVNAAIDEATRPEWVEAASSGGSITNSANKATFTFNALKTAYGATLVGGGSAPTTKGDTAGGGTLLCSVKFGTAKPVVSADVLKITVTLNATDVP